MGADLPVIHVAIDTALCFGGSAPLTEDRRARHNR
jgi:hypothetical protein